MAQAPSPSGNFAKLKQVCYKGPEACRCGQVDGRQFIVDGDGIGTSLGIRRWEE